LFVERSEKDEDGSRKGFGELRGSEKKPHRSQQPVRKLLIWSGGKRGSKSRGGSTPYGRRKKGMVKLQVTYCLLTQETNRRRRGGAGAKKKKKESCGEGGEERAEL